MPQPFDVSSLKTNTTITSGASATVLAADAERNSCGLSVDPAATAPVYILLGAGSASATTFTFALTPGGFWDGKVGQSIWSGSVQLFGTGAKVGVWAV